jgi:hypothetical protein
MSKSYKEEVVDQAILGLRQGGLPDPEAFRLVFERIYDCGYNECRIKFDSLRTPALLNREQVITEMCYTWRHDYGLIKESESDISGITVDDREFLWKQMAQLFDNCISKLLK